MAKAEKEEPEVTGFGTYKGRPIVAVSMELLRRSDAIDTVFDIDEQFNFVGRATVKKHDYEIQANGVHLILKVAMSEVYRTEETETKKVLEVKRKESRKAEEAREQREKEERDRENAGGTEKLPIGDIGKEPAAVPIPRGTNDYLDPAKESEGEDW